MDVPSSCYALLALLELSLAAGDRPLTREAIARSHSLPSNPLARVLSRLSRAGLVRSAPGRGGGHYLAVSAADISLAAVLAAAAESDGEAFSVPLCGGADGCQRYGNCQLAPLWLSLRARLGRLLDSISLADLSAVPLAADATPMAQAPDQTEVDSLPAVIVADANGRVVLANRSAESLTGWREGEARGQLLSELLPLERDGSLVDFADLLARVTAGESVDLGPGTSLKTPGGLRSVSGLASPMCGDGEGAARLRLTFWDVTERREAEQRLVAVNRLESAGVLGGKLARQFCDLLTGVVGSVSLARAQAGSASEVSRTLEWAEAAALVADVLLQQVLFLTGEHAPSSGPVSLPRILTDAVRLVTHGSAVRVSLRLDADLHCVTGDVALLHQALQGLLLNAVEAMPDGGALTVSATNYVVPAGDGAGLTAGDYVRVTIEDSGPGIPTEVRDRLFEPYRSTKKGRSGLGLLAAAAIVRQHGGTIALRSAARHGTIVEVTLPAAHAVAPAAQARSRSDERRAMVAEDEAIVVTVLSCMLQCIGYQTDATASLTDVETKLTQALWEGHPYAVVLIDTGLAGAGPLGDTVARLRQLDPDVRLIATCPYGDATCGLSPALQGFTAVLRKPFTFDDLKQVLRAPPAVS